MGDCTEEDQKSGQVEWFNPNAILHLGAYTIKVIIAITVKTQGELVRYVRCGFAGPGITTDDREAEYGRYDCDPE